MSQRYCEGLRKSGIQNCPLGGKLPHGLKTKFIYRCILLRMHPISKLKGDLKMYDAYFEELYNDNQNYIVLVWSIVDSFHG